MRDVNNELELLSLCPLRAVGAGLPLYCFPGAGGGVGIFQPMVSIMPQGRPVYAINAVSFFDAKSNFTIEQLANLCLQIIRKSQPRGPYYFCGYSLGGVLAYEAASRLADEGEDIGLLALFDVASPDLVSNLSAAETAEFRKRYLVDRLGRYGQYLRTGNFRSFTKDALHFLGRKVGVVPWSVALRSYTPKPYAKPLVLFCRQSLPPEHAFDPTLGWGRYALGGIDVYLVPGGHLSLLDKPQFLVEKLIAKLDHNVSAP